MAKVSLVLDTRENSRKSDGTYPISLNVYHKKTRFITLGYSTSILGWDDSNCKLRKSVACIKGLRCDEIDQELDDKLYQAKKLIRELGKSINLITVSGLVDLIKDNWDDSIKSEIKKKVENNISLQEWGKVLIERKENADDPGTAAWYANGITALENYQDVTTIKLYEITLTYLKNFEAHHSGNGNTKNTISIYLRAIRAIYNSAIEEDQFVPLKNPFDSYKIPKVKRTKKRARTKENINISGI
ncbi:phage integrase SAM-like domain-containing protein [uncultured Croceitalea sp.]|uniref:phage integrase SAM-like domain-containing protein n=1 Tax=uncultured Croceitalea sp. TaxID=1798908 RepID=UPI003305D8FD